MPTGSHVDINWIRSSREIRALRKKGNPVRGRNMVAWIAESKAGSNAASVGVVLSRGYHTAVERNLAKRRGRGCIMELREMFDPGYEYLIEYRPGSTGLDYQKLVNELKDILSNTRVAGT